MGNKGVKRRPKVLIVDDEASILHALSFFLGQQGYDTEAIAKFDQYIAETDESKLPDVIILDILLNQEDGLKIAKDIKANSKTSHIPVILISALPGAQQLASKAGADDFLAKPFDVHDLNAAVEKVL